MKKLSLFFLCYMCCLILSAQSQFRFRNFGTRVGLSHHQVNCLQVDSQGFLWIGTEFGLNKFDGVTFEKWFHNPADSTSLINNNIHDITEDNRHRLWIATEKGISIYDLKNGKFNSFRKIETQNSGAILLEQPSVYCDNEGDVWIGSAQGSAIVLKAADNLFYNIPLQLAPQGCWHRGNNTKQFT